MSLCCVVWTTGARPKEGPRPSPKRRGPKNPRFNNIKTNPTGYQKQGFREA